MSPSLSFIRSAAFNYDVQRSPTCHPRFTWKSWRRFTAPSIVNGQCLTTRDTNGFAGHCSERRCNTVVYLARNSSLQRPRRRKADVIDALLSSISPVSIPKVRSALSSWRNAPGSSEKRGRIVGNSALMPMRIYYAHGMIRLANPIGLFYYRSSVRDSATWAERMAPRGARTRVRRLAAGAARLWEAATCTTCNVPVVDASSLRNLETKSVRRFCVFLSLLRL